jgi:dTDP-4-dehydrorhamnose 3,5-epimerase
MEREGIAGVRVHALERRADERGELTELHRATWWPDLAFVQWNHLRSCAGVLRGIHVHPRHRDLVVLLEGRMRLGLLDLREDSPTRLREQALELDAADPRAVLIPNGVAHAFSFPVDALLLFAVDDYFDPADELACRWNDPAIGLFRDLREPLLSPRDAAAPPLAALRERLRALAKGRPA